MELPQKTTDPEIAKPIDVTERTRLIDDGAGGGAVQRRGDWGATMRLVLMGGSGMFADGWDLQVMNLVFAMLKIQYPDVMIPERIAFVASMTFVGVVVGQFVCGAVADIIGRKWASLATALLTIGGTVASACVTTGGAGGLAMGLAISRLVAGVGIGGEYPISAAISREMGEQENLCLSKEKFVQINVCMLTSGALAQAIFCYILLAANVSIENTWRCALGVGAFPSAIAIYLRMGMHADEAPSPHPEMGRRKSYTDSALTILFRTLLPNLVGCSLAWGLSGFSAYGQVTFLHLILDRLMESDHANVRAHLLNSALFAIVKCPITLSGNIACTLFLKYGYRIERVQCGAMLAMAACLGCTCLATNRNTLSAAFFLLSFGMHGFVGITAYSMPALIFPTKVRGTAVGIASGVGKVGACVGTALFPIIEATLGITWTLCISAMVLTSAALVTFVTPVIQLEPKSCK